MENAYKLVEKIKARASDPNKNEPATIVFLGDSVTNGCFEVDFDGERYLPVFDEENSYTAIFGRMIKRLYPTTQLNVINSGISGDNTGGGIERLQRDVLDYRPDMVVVCYGLNDCISGREGLKTYYENLKTIVKTLQTAGADVLIMTPNDITDSVHFSLRTDREKADAQRLAMLSGEGVFEEYMKTAAQVAEETGAALVDCYAIWKKLEGFGVDVNRLLSNKLNHPTRDMHFIFAYELLRSILGNV
ncbi:MAG: hypothetical protein IKJ91_02225 [Clostridia bacterium]|nr:hypothetical protein [Clostridia bacterium]